MRDQLDFHCQLANQMKHGSKTWIRGQWPPAQTGSHQPISVQRCQMVIFRQTNPSNMELQIFMNVYLKSLHGLAFRNDSSSVLERSAAVEGSKAVHHIESRHLTSRQFSAKKKKWRYPNYPNSHDSCRMYIRYINGYMHIWVADLVLYNWIYICIYLN